MHNITAWIFIAWRCLCMSWNSRPADFSFKPMKDTFTGHDPCCSSYFTLCTVLYGLSLLILHISVLKCGHSFSVHAFYDPASYIYLLISFRKDIVAHFNTGYLCQIWCKAHTMRVFCLRLWSLCYFKTEQSVEWTLQNGSIFFTRWSLDRVRQLNVPGQHRWKYAFSGGTRLIYEDSRPTASL